MPSIERMLNLGRSLLPYASVRRATNALRIIRSERRGDPVVPGLPFLVFLDPTNICNLRCPLCPTGLGRSGRPKGRMTLEQFHRVAEDLGPTALRFTLHNWGEPLLHPDIFQMVKFLHRMPVYTQISTNLAMLEEDRIDELLDSGLDELVVSLDGTSQASYQRYRIGGDFQRVTGMLRALMERKAARRLRTPRVEWQFLVMRHNEAEIPEAARLAREWGVDRFRTSPIGLLGLPYDGSVDPTLAEEWLPGAREHRYRFDRPPLEDRTCYWLWRGVVINHDGGVSPCCMLDDEGTDFGNLLEEPFRKIWNNQRYQAARRLVRGGSPPDEPSPCLHCRVFRRP